MSNEKNTLENVEQRLRGFFQKTAEALKAPSDLWSKLEPRLNEPSKGKAHDAGAGFGRWLAGPRLIGVAASVGVVLLLLVVGGVWLTHLETGGGNSGRGTFLTAVPTTTSFSSIAHGSGVAVPPPQITLTIPPVPTTSPSYGKVVPTTSPPVASGSESLAIGTSSNTNVLDTAQRQVIYQASISIEVKTVSAALTQVQTIAQSLGGLVDSMSSSGGPDQEQATITIRVPQDQFFTALDKLQGLGTVESQNLSTQDVTAQFIDLQARLTSAQAEEQSLLAILDKAQTVGDIISIQQQLTEVRSQIETLQGQINYIQGRVNMSSITVTLSTPAKQVGQPPSGSLTVGVSNVDASLASIKGLVTTVNGVIDNDYIAVNSGKESASLSLRVFRADFDRVMTAIEKQGKVQQKVVQEATGPQGQTQAGETPDARIDVSLTQSGFWTTANVVVVAVAGGVVLVTLLTFLGLAWRAGLLKKRAQ